MFSLLLPSISPHLLGNREVQAAAVLCNKFIFTVSVHAIKNCFSFCKYLLVVCPVFLVGAFEEAQGTHADISPNVVLFPAWS